MDGFGEVIGQEEGGDAVAGLVVHQDGAEQGLFRLKVLGRGAEGIVWPVGFDGAEVCLSGHGNKASEFLWAKSESDCEL